MTTDSPKKQRFLSVDILKALAVLLILNHRMHISYGDYAILATGGALGCALFFFLSGYTLNSAKLGSFKSWLQKRVGRLLLPIMVIGFLEGFTAEYAFLPPGIWFVQCIIVYYIAFYFIKKFFSEHILLFFGICSAAYLTFFLLMWHWDYPLYGRTCTKCYLFFIFFLGGALWRELQPTINLSQGKRIFLFLPALLCISGEMLFRLLYQNHALPSRIGFISPILLFSGVLMLTQACAIWDSIGNDSLAKKAMAPIFATIAALSLESYIGIGPVSYTLQTWLAPLFPFNIPLVMLLLLVFSYGLRVATRLCTALISSEEEKLKWSFILAPY